MKTIGMLGGMSWQSTIPYYRIINQRVAERLGGLHSARIILYSIDFEPMEIMQREGDWESAGALLADAAASLERAGAELLILCTNTMHKVADAIAAASSLPLLHIADATAAAIHREGLRKVGLLGTRFTMEERFYRARLEASGIEAIVPEPVDRNEIHRVIFEELCRGETLSSSRESYRKIIEGLLERGVEGVVLGCTEIRLLVGPEDVSAPLFDTTEIHARAAADAALAV